MSSFPRVPHWPALGLALALGLIAVASTWAALPVVSNVRASQRAGSGLVDIYYDVADADGDLLFITVVVSTNRGVSFDAIASSLSGPGYGSGVTPGNNKQIIWDAGSDWDPLLFPTVRVKVTAADGLPAEVKPIADMAWIPPGTFTMGSPTNETDRADNEGPQTQVTFTRGFWIGRYEVTQRLYQNIMSNAPSYFIGELNRPVEQVSWDDAMAFCAKLTEQEKQGGRLPAGWVYRLPTEAEWEYAARAGTNTRFAHGDDPGYGLLSAYAWYGSTSGGVTHPVGQKKANQWGLHDTYGNVWEWCYDWYSGNHPGGSITDPWGPSQGSYRMLRGGGWGVTAAFCRSAERDLLSPSNPGRNIGFRVALGRQ